MKSNIIADNENILFDTKYKNTILNFYSLLKEMEGWRGCN